MNRLCTSLLLIRFHVPTLYIPLRIPALHTVSIVSIGSITANLSDRTCLGPVRRHRVSLRNLSHPDRVQTYYAELR